MTDWPTIDCQDCGAILQKLTPAQAQLVAANPYNFVAYCKTCRRVHLDQNPTHSKHPVIGGVL